MLKNASKTAFVCKGESITWEEFDYKSSILACLIIPRTKGGKCPVLLKLEKSIDALIALVAVLKAGCFYTFADPNSPKERLDKIIQVLSPSLIISHEDYSGGNHLRMIQNYEGLSIDKALLESIDEGIIDCDLAYIFFTSGSTGLPKGVSISHKSVLDFASWACECFCINHQEILANQSPLYFDNSVLDIFVSLQTGACLHLLPNSDFAYPQRITSYLFEHKISLIYFVPSVLTYFANQRAELSNLTCLKKVLFCGEVLSTKALNYWASALPKASFANLYGPTEITDVCAFYKVDRAFSNEEVLPIGKACKNTQILLFDTQNALITKPFIKGELCVRGTCLSRGYYKDAQKSAAAFVQNPLHDDFKDLVYKTGDLASYDEHGLLLLHGRLDNQVKLMGHRVELGEIESVVCSHEGVANAVCLLHDERLVCFYEELKGEVNLRSFLKQRLPSYMIPRRFVRVDGFSKNANGKIDRKAVADLVRNS